ncbi:MAG: hypothetical protein ACRDVE_06130, partial [Actinocrinis sp.]
ERWADERAARAVGDRRLVAETIARAAVAAKRRAPRRSPAAALGAVLDRVGGGPLARRFLGLQPQNEGAPVTRRTLATAGPVPRRVAALLAPPLGRRWVWQVAVVAIVAVAALCAAYAAHDLHELLEAASYGKHHG